MGDHGLAQKYRSLARAYLDKAQDLINGTDDDLMSACLQLRQCIESLSYGLLVTYRHELSSGAMMSWIPRRVLDELEAADPLANTSRSVSIEIPGAEGAASTLGISGEDRRFSPKWANKAYNKLSNILHVPTPKALKAQSVLAPEKVREQCAEYARVLAQVFETEIWNFVSGQFVSHTCDCGFLIKRRVETINKDTVFECSECERKYDVTSIDDKQVGICLRVAQWACNACGSGNEMGAHELVEGKEIECPKCGGHAKIQRAWAFS
jgi:DNA-directed RNA polymerase subunit RPC12/RpoP